MAALSLGHCCINSSSKRTRRRIQDLKPPRILLILSCQREVKEKKEEKQGIVLKKIYESLKKIGKGLKDNLSPKQKGDWKDLVLMSLSFAVYVYISQQIVCAYCVWTSMFRQSW